jgi:hypothetical protein
VCGETTLDGLDVSRYGTPGSHAERMRRPRWRTASWWLPEPRDLSCRSPETARLNGGLSVARRRPSGEFQAASRATLGTWLWTAESHLGGAPCARGDHSGMLIADAGATLHCGQQ